MFVAMTFANSGSLNAGSSSPSNWNTSATRATVRSRTTFTQLIVTRNSNKTQLNQLRFGKLKVHARCVSDPPDLHQTCIASHQAHLRHCSETQELWHPRTTSGRA